MFNFFYTIRFRLILLILLSIIPVLGLTLYTGLEQREICAIRVKEDALRVARLISSNQVQLIESAHHFLVMLSKLPQVQQCDLESCSSLFSKLLKQYPGYLNIGAAKPDGYIFASAIPFKEPVNISDRNYFRLALQTRNFAIGDCQIGRITDKPGVNFGHPVIDESGKLVAVIFVAVDLTWLNEICAKMQLPPGSTLAVFNHNGMILAHYPEPERWVGKNLSEAFKGKVILPKRESTAEVVCVDGIHRLYAFTPFSCNSQAGNIGISIGIPASVAFAEVNQITNRNLILLGVVGLLALMAAWFGGDLIVLRRFNQVMATVKRLGAGDLSARTGMAQGRVELGQLAFAFDEMARSIEQREIERSQAERVLIRSQERYRELADLLPEVVFETDEKGNLTFANRYALNIFGYTQDDFDQGLDAFQMVVSEEREKAMEIFLEALNGKKSSYEFTMQRKDGSTFFAIIHVAPIVREGYTVGLRGIAVDITERKRAEEALRDSEAKYRTIFNTTGTATIIDEDDMTLSLVNTEFERVTGYSKEEVEGKKAWTDFIDKEHLEKMKEYHYMRRSDQNLAPPRYESRFIDKNGNGKDILLTVSLIPGTKKSVASFFDITEQKRAEKEMALLQEQFRQSQKMEAIGRLAGGIAHDFNNSLTLIKGYTQLSLIDLEQGSPLRHNIEEIHKAAGRAADLTHHLLAFSRRQILEVHVLDLNDILRNLEKMFCRIIGEDIELVTLLADDLGSIKSDASQIEQMIVNLVVNARDAMPNRGKLTIETRNVILDEEYAKNHIAVKPGKYVMLAVSDTGCGMTPEIKERVFEPFFTTKEKSKGTGLGLSTVYGIVKQSGGNIWVYSEVGLGTTFKIYLPRVDEPAEELPGGSEMEEIPRGDETVLVVEDDEAVRKLIVHMLESQGYTVLEAHEEYEALRFSREWKGPIHLVLTDVVMPKMSGRELVESLKKMRQGFKILYMSGYTNDAIVHYGVLQNETDFIQKPFTVAGLARKVREVLDKS